MTAESKSKIQIGILGGALDPVTIGHIKMAQFVLDLQSKLINQVWLMPCNNHMYNKKMSSPEHRLKMCEIATSVDPRIKVFNYEIRHKLRGETYNMVKRLQDEDFAKNQYDFSIIMGMDNANTFDKWVNYKELEKMIRFVVVSRKGINRNEKVDWYLKAPHIYLVAENEIPETSSTDARKLLQNQEYDKVVDLLNWDVIEYIKKEKLYGN